jgi:hypothetical protein
MKWEDEKDICFMSTHDEELSQTRVRNQSVKKPKLVTDYNLWWQEWIWVMLSWWATTTLEKGWKSTIRSTLVIWLASVTSVHICSTKKKKKKKKKQGANKKGWRPSGSPSKTAPPTNMTAPHYTCYITATASKQNPCQWCVVCYKMNQHRERRYSCEKRPVALCTVSCFKIYHTVVEFRMEGE